jgi:hypothetical protein
MDAIPCAAAPAAGISKPSSVNPALHRRCCIPFRQAEPNRNGLYKGLLHNVTGVPHHWFHTTGTGRTKVVTHRDLPVPPQNVVSLVGWAAVSVSGTGFFWGPFQGITGILTIDSHFKSLCNPIVHSQKYWADSFKSGARISLPIPPWKKPAKALE